MEIVTWTETSGSCREISHGDSGRIMLRNTVMLQLRLRILYNVHATETLTRYCAYIDYHIIIILAEWLMVCLWQTSCSWETSVQE